MKALFIGGTGTISTAISKLLPDLGWDLYLLNRGNRNDNIHSDIKFITADINDENKVSELIKNLEFDVVVDFICFKKSQLERDYRLFKNKTKQFIFISSASVYMKPSAYYPITESTLLHNPFWNYSRDKIECEEFLTFLFRTEGFPVTIVRPSHTYSERAIPLGVHGKNGSWQVADRMISGKQVIVHGDGTALWTMTDSRDFAKGFIGLMGNTHSIGGAVHITSDEALSWNQIYQSIANALNVEFKPAYFTSQFLAENCYYDIKGSLLGDKMNCAIFDNTKIKKLVPGFNANIRFDQGIKNTIDYILKNPELQIIDEEFDSWCDKLTGEKIKD